MTARSAVLITTFLISPILLRSQARPAIGDGMRRLGDLRVQSQRKGEFETTAQYQTRLAGLQREVERILAELYSGSGRVGVGAYDADKQTFPLRFYGDGFSVNLTVMVPRSEAREFKAGIPRMAATGEFWIEEDGRAYLAGSAILRLGSKTYRTQPADVSLRVVRKRLLCVASPSGPCLANPVAFTFSADGRFLFIENLLGERILASLWGVGAGRPEPTFIMSVSTAVHPVFSPTNDLIFAAQGRDGSQPVILDPAGRIVWAYGAEGQNKPVSCRFSPDGRLVACAFGPNGITVWDVATGQPVRTISSSHARFFDPVFRSDGTILTLGDAPSQTGGIGPTLWDASNDREIGRFGGFGFLSALSPDGNMLATITSDHRQLMLWNTSTGQQVQALITGGPQEGFFGAAFSTDSRFLVISRAKASQIDRIIEIWDSGTGKLLRTLAPGSLSDAIAISSGATLLATMSRDTFVVLEMRDMRK